MQRDFHQLQQGRFDLLVVGGGIYGAWTAYDATLRGLRVALIEQGDWAAATSSASSKLIHGGLRYLEYGHLGLVRKTLDERRRLARLGPHRVQPLRFLLPVYRGDRVGRTRLSVGMWIYDRLAGSGQPVARHRRLGREEVLQLAGLAPEGLKGGFLFGDCRTDDARYTLEIVDGAERAGAVAVNRASARELVVEGRRVVGARVEDISGGRTTIEVRAAAVVGCTGPWNLPLPSGVGASPTVATRLTKGVHLVLPALESRDALVISSNDDSRIVFLIPWYGRTLLGTTDTDYRGDPRAVRVERADVDYLLERANGVLANGGWTRADIVGAYAGLRTLPDSGGAPSRLTREWSLKAPLDGLLLSIGGKLTSARADAASLVDRVLREAGRPAEPSPTLERPFPWCPEGAFDEWRDRTVREGTGLGLDEETATNCAMRYGSRVVRLFEQLRQGPELARRIVTQAPFCLAEAVHAVREEMATTLEDVLRRRIPLVLLCRLADENLQEVSRLIARELDWTDERRDREVQHLTSKQRLEGMAP